MRYKIVLNIRYVADVVDGRFQTHLKEMQHLLGYWEKWKDDPVTIDGRTEPMDWDDPVKVWYKMMGNLPGETMLRAIPKDPAPPGVPPDAPGLDQAPREPADVSPRG